MTVTFRSQQLADHRSIPARARTLVRAHPFIAYVAIAYGLSWAYWIGMAVRGEVATPGGAITHLPGLLGPMIAAFLVTAVVGGRAGVGDLVARMLRWRVDLRWYALALLPFAAFLGGVVIRAAMDGTAPTLDGLGSYSGIPEVGVPAVVLLAFGFNGFGEEVGWRGFAQPTLRRGRGLVAACLGVALAWGLWHVPSFWVVESYRQMGLGVIPVFVVGLGSGAMVFGWLYERADSSILLVALAHLALNMGSATTAGRGLPAALVTTLIVGWAVVIVASEWRAARRERASGRGRAEGGGRTVGVGPAARVATSTSEPGSGAR